MTLKWWELDPAVLASLVDDGDVLRFRPGMPAAATQPGPEVQVLVEDIGAGVWARFCGTLGDGTPVTMSGAVVGGPDPVGDGGVVAVAVRDYRGNPDVIVYMGAGECVTLVDDPADHEARIAHGLAPVFGPVKRAIMMEWVGENRRRGRWVDLPPVDDPSPAEMAEMERGGPDLHLSVVYRGHLPIEGFDRP